MTPDARRSTPRIWQKPGTLTADEREQVRLHAYHTERAFSRSPVLAAADAFHAMTEPRPPLRVEEAAKIADRHIQNAYRRRRPAGPFVEAGDGPPLVLLHGTGVAALFLKPLLGRLTACTSSLPTGPATG